MNKNIKFAIYFLLGIVLFYLMFNGNGVEGFGEDSPPAYSITIGAADSQAITCTKKNNTTTQHGITGGDNELLTGILSNITTHNPIYYSSNDNQLILIQSNESICINSENSVVDPTPVAWTRENCPSYYWDTNCRPTDGPGGNNVGWSEANCTADVGTLSNFSTCTPSGDPPRWTADNCPQSIGVLEVLEVPRCTTSNGVPVNPIFEEWTVDDCSDNEGTLGSYFYIIHMVTDEASPQVTTTNIYRSTSVDGTYLKYEAGANVGDNPVQLEESETVTVTAVTVTAVTASTCATWFTSNNCTDSGKVNNSETTPCPDGPCSEDICCSVSSTGSSTTTYPYTCTNGSSASGSSETENEERCVRCDPGYHKTGSICIQNGSGSGSGNENGSGSGNENGSGSGNENENENGSEERQQEPVITTTLSEIINTCSTFITDSNKCPEGEEVIEDKSCSGTCTTDQCCEEESKAVMIGLGVCLVILFIILGIAAYHFMGKKSPDTLVQTAPAEF